MIFAHFLILVMGFVLLVKGADYFVEGAAGIASKAGIPQLVVGLTIVAMGTSLPEAAVSITASVKGSNGIAIGNVVGSNILNILIILGITSVLIAVPIRKSTLYYEIPFMIFITLLLLGIGFFKAKVSRASGVIFWILFIAYLVYLFFMAKKGNDEEEKCNDSLIKLVLFLVLGAAVVVLGSNLTVNAATKIAEFIGISDRIIGLTIVALGTSLPELVTSVVAAKKGNADIAIGNIVGSNIFNILFVLGTAALIHPIPYSKDFIADGVFAVLAAIILLLAVIKDRTLKRPAGIIMLLTYGIYFIYLLM